MALIGATPFRSGDLGSCTTGELGARVLGLPAGDRVAPVDALSVLLPTIIIAVERARLATKTAQAMTARADIIRADIKQVLVAKATRTVLAEERADGVKRPRERDDDGALPEREGRLPAGADRAEAVGARQRLRESVAGAAFLVTYPSGTSAGDADRRWNRAVW